MLVIDVEHFLELELLLKKNLELGFNDLAFGYPGCHVKDLVIDALDLLVDETVEHLLVLCHLDLTFKHSPLKVIQNGALVIIIHFFKDKCFQEFDFLLKFGDLGLIHESSLHII